MALLKFKDWLELESSASTRTRRDVALGLKPMAALGSVHGHSTAAPWEVEKIKSKLKKKVKAKKKTKKSVPKNNQVDSWLQKAEDLKMAVDKLKQAFSKKGKEASKKPDVKFAVPKDDPYKKDQGEADDSGKEQSGVQSDKERDQGDKGRESDKRDSSDSKQRLSKK